MGGHGLSEILHSWKSYTSNEVNSAAGRSGQFWFPEYYDRFIRDEGHFVDAVEYIEMNPAAAGLRLARKIGLTEARASGGGARGSSLHRKERPRWPRSQARSRPRFTIVSRQEKPDMIRADGRGLKPRALRAG